MGFIGMKIRSYQLQKITDKIIIDMVTYDTYNSMRISQQKNMELFLLELRLFRKYLYDKKLNCLTCNRMNLDFEEAYVKCFREKNHCIELITEDIHVPCKLLGRTIQNQVLYKGHHVYCENCNQKFEKKRKFCVCCNRPLRHHPTHNVITEN